MIETSNLILTNRRQHHLSLPRHLTKGQTLYWRQPKRFKSAYLLQSQDQVIGSMRFEGNNFIRRGISGTEAGELRFKFSRFSLPKVTISSQEGLFAEVILEVNWGWYGSLDLPGGHQYIWKPSEIYKNQYHFTDTDDYPIVTINPRPGFLKIESEVNIDPAGFENPHLTLLTMLGWFLVLLRMN
jgi:hypothetical protein